MTQPNETAISKNKSTKTNCLVFTSMASGGFGIVFFMLGTKTYDVLGLGYTLFTAIALVLGVMAIVKIISSGEISKVSGVAKLIILPSVGTGLFLYLIWLMHLTVVEGRTYGRANLQLSKLHKVIVEYSKEHEGSLPMADRWCDQLMEYDDKITKYDFITLRPGDVCNFGFNRSLSGLHLSKIPGNTVLLFETIGDWNLNSGPELLKKRKLDIHILLVNGSIYRYRFLDGEMKRYDPNSQKLFFEPLRWKL